MPREDGVIIITGESGRPIERTTHQCSHCGQHFISVKGSGVRRGFCTLCNYVTCGAEKCMPHFAWEKKLDLVESGKLPLIALK